ncbi:cytochrome c oxidase subunit II [Haloferax sp. Atlit-12N]|uniref:cytochrome c oxidase subunit II n=1 Tax=Haloferax sp. Atlit-12N TaxID=2077203 RepID=UPI000E235E6B|nr:cytochrome c oxidase subunit II [Haloferax sp. Atlit-12N]RDZ65995.1 cytochrome c oxidase subunit II [Haloferax sp. Atlit-12N]
MSRLRSLVKFALVAMALALVAAPVAAQSINRAAIDELNTQLLYVALPLTLFVELVLFYAIYRFRNNDDPKPTTDDPALEITWTVATAVILVFVGISGYYVLTNPYLTPAVAAASGDDTADMEVEVVAYQWGWEFRYPEENITTQNRLVIPQDRDVRLVMESEDVIHSIYVPDLGVKQDIFPSQEQVARTRATQTGEYDLYCAELCGTGHSRMHGQVVVMTQSEYDSWVDAKTASSGTATVESATNNSTASAVARNPSSTPASTTTDAAVRPPTA